MNVQTSTVHVLLDIKNYETENMYMFLSSFRNTEDKKCRGNTGLDTSSSQLATD